MFPLKNPFIAYVPGPGACLDMYDFCSSLKYTVSDAFRELPNPHLIVSNARNEFLLL
jgi:hypothetical protein